MDLTRPLRVGVINTHVIQYFAPMYRYINENSEMQMVPIYLSTQGIDAFHDEGFGESFSWDIDLLTNTNAVFVSGAERRSVTPGPLRMMTPAVIEVIRREHLDALILHGHNTGANHLALIAARVLGIPVFSRCETHLGLPTTRWRSTARAIGLRSYYRLFAGCLAIGSANRRYYRSLGVPEERIFLMPYSVDNTRYSSQASLSATERHSYRSRLGIDDDSPVITFASKLSPRKRAADLILACQILHSQGQKFHLVIAGSGEEESELRQLASSCQGLRVHFTGFMNQSELPKLFGSSEVFVLPSEAEPWGLVVNEAMCAGLPVVTTRDVGAAEDLVRSDENGYVYDVGNVVQLAEALERLISDARLAQEFGESSRMIIQNWDYAACLDGLTSALASR